MITYKEKLVKFVKLKKKHIKKFGFIYVDYKDYKNIRSWPEEICKEIYKKLVSEIVIANLAEGLSSFTCPWCIYHNSVCDLCYYGKRYGVCAASYSAYKRYNTKEVKEYFTNEIYIDIINEIFYARPKSFN